VSDTESEDVVAQAPLAGPLLARAGVAWLEPVRRQLAAQHDRGRLPHGLLLTGVPGAGQAEIGAWLASRVLCRGAGAKPCAACADCRLFLAGNHPDFRWVGVLADRKEIGIDQMRALSASLALRSYRGGAKVAVIAPAEAMSIKSYNALLKTLEEPASDTYLVLAASRIDRMPKTVTSRTQRLRIPVPSARDAIDWLQGRSIDGDLPALLAFAGGAPFLAAEYAASGLGELEDEMQEAIAAAAEGRLDFVSFADRSAKNAPAARLTWLESWLTRSLKEAARAGDQVGNNRLRWLRPPGQDRKIRAGYGLLDQLREARRQVGGPLNTQLLFEELSVSLAALVGRRQGQSGDRTD
jgi:DNA polymerase III subunit delta'